MKNIPDYNPTGFSKTIFEQRYALTPEETWPEACSRVAKQMALAETPDKQKAYEDKFNEVLVKNLFVPGGRIWYGSGKNNPNLLNCLSGDTLILTKEFGSVPIKDVSSKKVTLLDGNKNWVLCDVYSHGEQLTYEHIFKTGKAGRTTAAIRSTLEHNWISADGDKVETKYLDKDNTIIENLVPDKIVYNQESYTLGIQHGLIYGDGNKGHANSFNYRICDDHEEILKLMEPHYHTNPPSSNGDPHVYIPRKKAWCDLKQLPIVSNKDYLLGFLRGWFAADGCVSTQPEASICGDQEEMIWIQKWGPVVGWHVTGCTLLAPITNYGQRKKKSSNIRLKHSSLCSEDFILNKHRKRWIDTRSNRNNWYPTGEYRLPKLEQVYCPYVPTTNSFALASGIHSSNCFVLNSELDSKEGWGNVAREMIITSMSGGGVGIDFSDVRPRGAPISVNKGECPGPVELMNIIDSCADPVRAGGGRRSALMFSLDLDHPDIQEFFDAKSAKGRLTHANVSCRSNHTTTFIKAVKENKDIELSWKGKFKKSVSAKVLWDQIVANAYKSAEPGFLNWELVNSENTISYIGNLVSTNPCGEIPMQAYENCCLGHLMLPRFVDDGLNYTLLAEVIRIGVRFLDNVLSVNTFPLPEMKEKSAKLRRIGLGVTGFADMLALLGIKYGSEEAHRFIDKLFRFISKVAYEASVMLAIEKGAFPLCNPDKHIETGYVKRMTPKIRSLILEHGIRNSAVLTNAPTGTVSILSGNCSSGVEPIFAPAYERRYWKGTERLTELVYHPLFVQFMETGRSVEHFVSSRELSVRDHLETQKIIQKHIDNAISKTINIPEDYSVQDMSDVWLEYLPFLKGTTFYRENSRGYVDEQGIVHEPPLTALTLEEAKMKFDKQEKLVQAELELVDCPSGVCEV